MMGSQSKQSSSPRGRRSHTAYLGAGGGSASQSADGTPNDVPDLSLPPSADWDIRREIARGGMGIVYLAFDPTLDRFLAVKRLVTRGMTDNGTLRARFLREARAMATLNHIHICRIYAIGDDAEGPWIAMEYVAGPDPAPNPREPPAPFSLESMIHRHGALSQEQTVSLIRKIAGAVAHAHRHDVVHRDLKPGNVLIDQDGEPRIVDFGLAALTASLDERLTVTGDKLLSLGYGAPEQEEDATRVDHRADIYALGGLTYFCLTGDNPRFYRDHRVPAALRPVLIKAMERDRDHRWPTASDFVEALSDALNTAAAPVPGRDGWLCKWCHALNAMDDRYCVDCGWDGLIHCPQCEAPMRFGMRCCPSCNADLRAFEDAGGLLELLRDLRRQKAFDRLLAQAQSVDKLRAAGAVNETVYRQILELRQGAAWALERKAALRQAIDDATAADDYERIRELLNEYDVIDNGDTYGDLRARLPEKIATRHIGKLQQRLETARTFREQNKLASCRAMMTALRDQQQSIAAMAADIPALQPRDPAGADTTAPADAGDPASCLDACNRAIAALDRDLTAEEERIQAWVDDAGEALQHQDYDHCIRLCREVEMVTVEPTPANDLLQRAMHASRTIDELIKAAGQAVAARRWRQADDLSQRILTQWKANHTGALKIRDSLARHRTVHRLRVSLVAACLLIILYLGIVPPWIRLVGTPDPPNPWHRAFLRPALQLYKYPPLRQYARFWRLPL